jgi:hypothetical protein
MMATTTRDPATRQGVVRTCVQAAARSAGASHRRTANRVPGIVTSGANAVDPATGGLTLGAIACRARAAIRRRWARDTTACRRSAVAETLAPLGPRWACAVRRGNADGQGAARARHDAVVRCTAGGAPTRERPGRFVSSVGSGRLGDGASASGKEERSSDDRSEPCHVRRFAASVPQFIGQIAERTKSRRATACRVATLSPWMCTFRSGWGCRYGARATRRVKRPCSWCTAVEGSMGLPRVQRVS